MVRKVRSFFEVREPPKHPKEDQMSAECCDQPFTMSSTNGPNLREAASYQRTSMEEVSKGDSSISELKMDLDKRSTPNLASTPTTCVEDNDYANPSKPLFFLQLENTNTLALPYNIQGQVHGNAP